MTGARRPVIGLCAAIEPVRWSFWSQDAAVVATTYLDAVREAAGLPLALIPDDLDADEIATLVDRVDGVLLLGGADLDPAVYGEIPSPRTEMTVPLRDRFELAVVREALRRDLPVLGVCRGLQILNVAAGGTLHQHLLDHGYAEHRAAPGRLDDATAHEVELEPDSLVARSAGCVRGRVNSHHHQGIAVVGAGGRVTGRSVPDGVVEAIEWPEQRYAVGVQWHPEAWDLGSIIGDFVRVAAQHVSPQPDLAR